MELVLHGRINDQNMSMGGSFINVFSSNLNIVNPQPWDIRLKDKTLTIIQNYTKIYHCG